MGGEGPAVCLHGVKEPGGDSPTALSLCPKVKLQVPPLRYAPVGMTNLGVAVHLGGGEVEGQSQTTRSDTYQKANLDKYG